MIEEPGRPLCPRRIVILEEVKTFLVDFPDGLLLNILPAELHARVHIPGSKQACVFERAFPELMEKLAPDPATPILVYGAGASLDAAVATAKLLGLGYLNVRMWPGGLKTWRSAGLPLEGEQPNTPLEEDCVPADGSYELLPLEGDIRWTGRSSHASHYGHLFLKSGRMLMKKGRYGPEGTGEIVADMCSIVADDLAGSPWQRVLLSHLASEDFFHSALYPEARLRILRLFPLKVGLRRNIQGLPNYRLQGDITVRGRTEQATASRTSCRPMNNRPWTHGTGGYPRSAPPGFGKAHPYSENGSRQDTLGCAVWLIQIFPLPRDVRRGRHYQP